MVSLGAKWYLHDGQQQKGPLTEREVADEVVRSPFGTRFQVWTEGMAGWLPMEQVPALAQARAGTAAPVAPLVELEPQQPVHVQQPAIQAQPAQAQTRPQAQTQTKLQTRPAARPVDKTGDFSMMIEVAKLGREDTGPRVAPELAKNAAREAAAATRAERRARERAKSGGLGGALRLLFALALLGGIAAGAYFYFMGTAQAAPPPQQAPARPAPQSEKMDVEKFKERYWAKGEESELRVVQNRLYSKSGKFEIALLGGPVSTDPFLSVYTAGGLLNYHLNEYFAIGLLGWKYLVGPSSALQTLQNDLGDTANTNEPGVFFGSEVAFSPLYGKLSLLGKAIIYLDTHITAGAGSLSTETGSYIAPMAGIGEQIFLGKHISLRLDARFMYFTEALQQKDPAQPGFGQNLPDTRTNISTLVSLGLAVMF